MTASFPLATALKHGACIYCSTAARIVFHYEETLKPPTCRAPRMDRARQAALRALPWLRSAIGRS